MFWSLESRSINVVDANWKRIIKPKMSTGMVKYSVSEAEEKKPALNKLKNLKLEKCDNLEEYINRLINLKDLAGIKEDTSLTDYLLRGLEMDLYSPVSLNISQSRHKEKDTLDYAIS